MGWVLPLAILAAGCGEGASPETSSSSQPREEAKPAKTAAAKDSSPKGTAAAPVAAGASAGKITAKVKGKDVSRDITGAVVTTDSGSKSVGLELVLGCPDLPNTCEALVGDSWTIDAGPLGRVPKACPDFRIVKVNLSVPGYQAFPKVAPGPLKKAAAAPDTNSWVSISGPNVETDNAQFYPDTVGELTSVSATEVAGKILAESDGNRIEGTFTAKVCKLPPQ